jgi:tetratricopeptide (TPR) repeat protein
MGIYCDSCGRPAPEGAPFRRVRGGHRCPACLGRRQHLWHRLAWLGFLTLTSVGLVAAARHGRPGWGLAAALALSMSLFLALLPAVILSHEAGHALAAWLLGLRVFSFTVGHGRLLGWVRLLGVRWQLRVMPNAGLVEAAHPTLRFCRLKQFLVVLAGPLTNALLMAAALWWWPPTVLYRRALAGELAVGHFVALTFAWANFLSLLGTLLPIQLRQGGRLFSSDGRELLKIPFYPRAGLEGSHSLYFARQGDECMWEGRYAEALAWYERGLALYPDQIINAYGAAVARLGLRQLDEARKGLDALRAREDLTPAFRTLLSDAVATVVLAQAVRGRAAGEAPERLAEMVAEGERRSVEALNASGGFPLSMQWSLMGTYGAYLVEQDKVADGERVLRLARTELESPAGQAWCLSYLAVAAARQGRVTEARAALAKARRTAPACIALERAEWELAQRAGAAA